MISRRGWEGLIGGWDGLRVDLIVGNWGTERALEAARRASVAFFSVFSFTGKIL